MHIFRDRLAQIQYLIHCILVDSSTVICWMSPGVILGECQSIFFFFFLLLVYF